MEQPAQWIRKVRGGLFMSTLEKQKASQTMYGVEPYKETKGEEYMGDPMRKHFTMLLA